MPDYILRIRDDLGDPHDLAYQDTDGNWALLTTDQDIQNKFAPVLHAGAVYSSVGDHTLVDPPLGQKVMLTWFHVQAAKANLNPVVVTIRLGATEVFKVELSPSQPMAHGAIYLGIVDANLIVHTNNSESVYVNCDYRIVT